MKRLHLLSIVSAAVFLGGKVLAAPIDEISPSSLVGTQLITFEDVPGGDAPGTNYDNIIVSAGVQFAERFVGQTNNPAAGFDVLSGSPNPGLALAVGGTNQNLSVVLVEGNQSIGGLGSAGFPSFDAIGEGAIAILFSTDQSEFGFDIFGSNSGDAVAEFFRRDGSSIASITLSQITDRSYAFRRGSGAFDIAGITIVNSDVEGIGFDNMRFDVPSLPVPEPTMLMMSAFGLVLVAFAARRQKVLQRRGRVGHEQG